MHETVSVSVLLFYYVLINKIIFQRSMLLPRNITCLTHPQIVLNVAMRRARVVQ